MKSWECFPGVAIFQLPQQVDDMAELILILLAKSVVGIANYVQFGGDTSRDRGHNLSTGILGIIHSIF